MNSYFKLVATMAYLYLSSSVHVDMSQIFMSCQIDKVCTEYSFVKTNKQVHQEASVGDGYAKDKKDQLKNG